MPFDRLSKPLLPALLAVESGVDLRRHAWYRSNLHEPVLRSMAVERPGRCRRDPRTGALIIEQMTVQQYFASLGVADLFDPRDPGCLASMQYRSVNALGFFGYQFGEAALVSLGVYRPRRVRVDHQGRGIDVDCLYSGAVPASCWAAGRRAGLQRVEGQMIWATDVNTWAGTFTGRHGIWTYEDCMSPASQELLVRQLLERNLCALEEVLAAAGATLDESLRRRGADLSGVLAGAHLCGPAAVAEYLLGGVAARDELGTTLEEYVARFAEHEVPPVHLRGRTSGDGLLDDERWVV
ncbi:hypothetical protein WME95_05520 [Sorangium sp. So ce327]|uniref:hypothetical protein n=1 Tax=Sorangium sp. So ce327 TaxID=3133301 RepID=UPI003F63A2FC